MLENVPVIEVIDITSLITGLLLAFATFAAGYLLNKVRERRKTGKEIAEMLEQFQQLLKEHNSMLFAQRHTTKNSIIRICNEAIGQGFIAHSQLEGLCRLYEGYKSLGGNTFIRSMIEDKVFALPVHSTQDDIDIGVPPVEQIHASFKEESWQSTHE